MHVVSFLMAFVHPPVAEPPNHWDSMLPVIARSWPKLLLKELVSLMQDDTSAAAGTAAPQHLASRASCGGGRGGEGSARAGGGGEQGSGLACMRRAGVG